eukprot:1153379-Pelagomonas_calceolata.AAC.9
MEHVSQPSWQEIKVQARDKLCPRTQLPGISAGEGHAGDGALNAAEPPESAEALLAARGYCRQARLAPASDERWLYTM